ncbi:MAG: hypothetical protein ABR502_09860 [Chitinophagaceae bacterium]
MSKQPDKCRLDRTAFAIMAFEEADNHYGYWKHKSLEERLDAGYFLIHQFLGMKNTTPLDRSITCRRKHSR